MIAKPPKALELTQEDLNSACWKKIEAYIDHRFGVLHKEIENDFDAEKTANIRGRMKELRKLVTESAAVNTRAR